MSNPLSDVPGASALLSLKDKFELAKAYEGLPYLASIPGSAAERSGLQPGDIVVRVNGLPTPDADAFVRARSTVEGEALVAFVRDGVEREVRLVWDTGRE